MSNTQDPQVNEILGRLRGRQRRLNVVRFACHGLLWGTVAAAAATALAMTALAQTIGELWGMALAWLPAGAVAGAIIGLLVPIDPLRAARALDHAADSEDRFASALQLAEHHRRDRVRLVTEDALMNVRGTTARTALPLTTPRSLRRLPLVMAVLALLLLVAPRARVDATTPMTPDVTAEEWNQLHEEFSEQVQRLPEPRTAEERAMREELDRLASRLTRNPDKRDVLAQLARLQAELQRRQTGSPLRNVSLKSASRAMQSSGPLKQFASSLRQGNYKQAANALKKLAKQLQAGELPMTATQFEQSAADFDRMARELASHKELQNACQNCSGAAGSMNRQRFGDSLRDLAEALERNADMLRENDQNSQCNDLLENLQRRIGECSACAGCKNGCSACQGGNGNQFVQGSGQGASASAKKGGLRAGWGSAKNWASGSMDESPEQRMPTVALTRETDGQSTAYPAVSNDERAQSGLDFNELYAEFVQKAEADLDLDMVPVAYREFLGRYFRGIRPSEEESGDAPDQ